MPDAPPATATHAGLASVLTRLAEHRDRAAWAELLETCGADIERIARRLTGNAALAEDAVQETLLQLRDHAGKFRTTDEDRDEAARRWCLRVAATTTLMLMRSRKRAADRDRAEGGRQEREMPPIDGPHHDVERAESAAVVRSALAQLPEASRTALALHYVAGLGYHELAAELGVPVGTAKTRVHRALETLRARLRPLAGSLSVAAIAQRLGDLPAPPAHASLSHHVALLDAPMRASLSGLPATGATAMTIKIALACAATLAIGILPAALSQDGISAPGPRVPGDAAGGVRLPAMPAILAKKITCDFTNATFEEVVAALRGFNGLNIVVDPDLAAVQMSPITLAATDMSQFLALTWVAELSETRWSYANQAVVFSRADPQRPAQRGDHGFDPASIDGAWRAQVRDQLDQLVTLDFQDTPLRSVIDFIRKVTGLTVVLDPHIPANPPTITLKVSDMSLRNVVDFVTLNSGLRSEVRDGALFICEPTDAASDTKASANAIPAPPVVSAPPIVSAPAAREF